MRKSVKSVVNLLVFLRALRALRGSNCLLVAALLLHVNPCLSLPLVPFLLRPSSVIRPPFDFPLSAVPALNSLSCRFVPPSEPGSPR